MKIYGVGEFCWWAFQENRPADFARSFKMLCEDLSETASAFELVEDEFIAVANWEPCWYKAGAASWHSSVFEAERFFSHHVLCYVVVRREGQHSKAVAESLNKMTFTEVAALPDDEIGSWVTEKWPSRSNLEIPLGIHFERAPQPSLLQELCRAADRRLMTGRSHPGDEVPLSPEEVKQFQEEVSRRRPAYARDHLWFNWHKQDELGPAKIRDRWNGMSDEERRTACPRASWRIGGKDAKGKRSALAVVVTALKKARKERHQGL